MTAYARLFYDDHRFFGYMHGLAKTRRAHGALELIDIPKPDPGPNDVIVSVDWAGLCGSDGGIYEFESAFERMELPTVIGHEYAGRIEEVGASVTAFAPGDRVIEVPFHTCGECYQCRRGQSNVCQNGSITGVDHHGAYAPFVRAPSQSLIPIPDGLTLRVAATSEPLGVAVRAVTQNSRIRPGDVVLVEGPGPIGLFAAHVARAQGAQVVVSGIDKDEAVRLPLARELGFETCNVAHDDVESLRASLTDADGYDVVIDTTGHPSGLTTAVSAVRRGGQIVLVGQTGETTMPYSPLVRGEIDLQCSYSASMEDVERGFALMDDGKVDVEAMIGDDFSLREPDAAFEAFLAGEVVKPLFDLSELADSTT